MRIFKILSFSILPFFLFCAQIGKESLGTANNTVTAPNATAQAGVYLADTVTEAPGHTGSGFYDKSKAVNGVRGSGTASGGLDVFSLDNTGASSHIVLSWSGRKIKNDAGADFIVYENPFYSGGNASLRFMDLIFVEVSNDNISYCGFAPDFTGVPESTYSMNPALWPRFAGRVPVRYNVETNNLSVSDLFQDNDADGEPDLGGGDAFNLDDLSNDNYYNTGCTTPLRDDLRSNGFRYLRLVPAGRRINPGTGSVFVVDGVSFGPDIDGVAARYVE